LNGRIACGWKVGCTSEQTQALLGTNEPIAGRLFRDRVHRSPATLTQVRRDMPLVEAEFAFTLSSDLPSSGRHDRAAVESAIGSLHLAFEVVEARLDSWRTPSVLESIADNASHGDLVLGEAITSWRQIDLPAVSVKLHTDGRVVAEGEGRRVLGDPIESLVWLSRFLSRRHLGLRAGEVVTTGTCIGAPTVPFGVPVFAEYDGVGRIELLLREA
jgi:2-keto-4-pentenoate hydratase